MDVHDYKYTSWHEYFNHEAASHGICNTGAVLSKMSLDKLSSVIADMVPRNAKCIDIDKSYGKLPDDCIAGYILEKYSISDPYEIKDCTPARRNEIIIDLLDFGCGVRQLSRLTSIDKTTISRLK